MTWTVLFTPAAQRHIKQIRSKHKHLIPKLEDIIATLKRDPFDPSHQYEPLKHNLSGLHSRRLSMKDRVVYSVKKPEVIVVSSLGHYGD